MQKKKGGFSVLTQNQIVKSWKDENGGCLLSKNNIQSPITMSVCVTLVCSDVDCFKFNIKGEAQYIKDFYLIPITIGIAKHKLSHS